MASATQAPADAAGPTSHTLFQDIPPLPAAAARLLRLLAEHDQGAGVYLEYTAGRLRHAPTGTAFTVRTARVLGARRLVTFGATAWDPIHITTAGRTAAAACPARRRTA